MVQSETLYWIPNINMFYLVSKNFPRGKLSPGYLPPGQFPPRIIAPEKNRLPLGKLAPHHKISLENNCPHSNKFPLNEYYKWTENNYALSTSTIIYEYCNLGVKSDLLPYILTKPCRTPLIRECLSLNVSLFSSARTQKYYIFLEKLIRKKIQKNFIVNNNNRINRAWYLRQVPGEHTYLPGKTGIFYVKIRI